VNVSRHSRVAAFLLLGLLPALTLGQDSTPAARKAAIKNRPAPGTTPAQPEPTPPPAATPATATAPAEAQSAEELNDLKVKTLEERVSDLKEKVFRTKARLINLQEMVVGGDITAGAKAVVIHRNEMGSSFYLESVTYALDGAPIYVKTDVEGDLEKREEFEVFNGRVVPGNHQLTVQMIYRGHGFGVFSYLEDYRFKVQASHTFDAEPGKVLTVKAIGYEKGGMTTELKDRPAINFTADAQREEAPKAGAGEGPKK
jgi:uncharacterized small protein (DUF1192 family)